MLIDWKNLPAAQGMRHGSMRQAICGELMSAVRVTTSPDSEFDGKMHTHDNEQILVMVSGRITLRIEDETFDAKPGDLVFFPPGKRHAAVAVGGEGAVYYELFAPARTDQLPGWVGRSVLVY